MEVELRNGACPGASVMIFDCNLFRLSLVFGWFSLLLWIVDLSLSLERWRSQLWQVEFYEHQNDDK